MITVVEQVKYRFHYGFLNSAVPSLYFSLAKRRTVKIINGSDMQYRHERGQSEFARTIELGEAKDCKSQ